MRILVVDDEVVSRKKMEKIMDIFGQCVAVDSGEAALKAFGDAIAKGRPFDVITLDVSMPQMDGTEVLYEIRKIEKQRNIPRGSWSKVVMVTAQSDKDTVTLCIQVGCDNYITKPFDRAIVAKKLAELGIKVPVPVREDQSIRKIVMETIDRFKKGNISLPVLSQISREIDAIINNPSSGVEDLARILEKDAAISVKLIATSNSALYRGVDKVQDLRTAITRLGAKEVQNIVSVISNKDLYESKNKQFHDLLKCLWLNSLACAYSCRAIAVKLGGLDSGKVFLMGLTHNIGCVILIKSIGDIATGKMEFDKNELMESLNEVHTSFGAALLDKWGFDREFSEVVRLHKWSSFEKRTKREILIVNLADKISSKIKFGFFDGDADLTNLESAKALGIDEKTIEGIAEEVKLGMKEVERLFH
ncbi:MAG: HDOD domain-containing protein [Deltaproteobacteria bacterium]|nr:HDOD domain-containing protein [Deltaproteobacteria bacterium]